MATSRPASVPSGKSQSGRSPRTGLYTHFSSTPSAFTVPNSVALEASTSRPVMSMRPRRSSLGTAGSRGSNERWRQSATGDLWRYPFNRAQT